jgi:hypothetical protein
MTNELVDFWRSCEWVSAPYVHPNDLPILQNADGRHTNFDDLNFSTFLANLRFDHYQDRRLHLSLLPQPYCGDLSRADIFILLLNPGFSYTDYYGESRVPTFRQRLMTTLKQEFGDTEFPFIWLDPEFCWHGGFVWWETKLRDVLSIIAERKFDGSYIDAVRDLSKRLASIELVPYHSRSFGAHSLLTQLPSVETSRLFARDVLAPNASAGRKTVIVTRRSADWGMPPVVPPGAKELIIYQGGQKRGASLGRNTPGGKAILRRYAIED